MDVWPQHLSLSLGRFKQVKVSVDLQSRQRGATDEPGAGEPRAQEQHSFTPGYLVVRQFESIPDRTNIVQITCTPNPGAWQSNLNLFMNKAFVSRMRSIIPMNLNRRNRLNCLGVSSGRTTNAPQSHARQTARM